jgi:hypothetical protein
MLREGRVTPYDFKRFYKVVLARIRQNNPSHFYRLGKPSSRTDQILR